MGLKIAQKIMQEINFSCVPTNSDTVPTLLSTNESAFPTNRHVRQPERASNDNQLHGLITIGGMPAYFYDGGVNGWQFGDQEWIAGKLRRIQSKAERLRLDAEPIEHRKDGKASFSTNSWLLKATK